MDPALAAWSLADRPEMLHAEGPQKHGDEGHKPHRDPGLFGVWSALVTRLIAAKSPEFHSEPYVAALRKELDTLRAQGVWNEDGVREWRSVRGQSGKDGKDDLVGRLFGSWVGRMLKTEFCRICGNTRQGLSSLEIIYRLRQGRGLTSCSRNSRKNLLRWVLSGQHLASRHCNGTSPKSGMRPRPNFKLESTARIGRALGCDCRGSGGRRLGLMLRGNRFTRTL